MNIAVDARAHSIILNKSNPGIFLECVQLLAVQKKEHRFFLIYENIESGTGDFSSNVEYVSCARFGKKGLLRNLLPDLKLAVILKRIKADVLISFDEISSTSLPQVLVLSESGKINEKTIKDVSIIIVNSDWHKALLEKKYKSAPGKIETISAWPGEMFTPITDEEKPFLLPNGWDWVRLNDVTTGMDSGWSPACLENNSPSDTVWGVLKTTAVQVMQYLEHENKELPEKLVPRPEAETKVGDILFTRAGPTNRVAISCLVQATRPKLMISDKRWIQLRSAILVLMRLLAMCQQKIPYEVI